ncbi:MAG: hypothetical protein JW852_09415 [Spirochaetales bacterium]|nr:hypothetical protein [Spirochaetales bacterium]
MNKKATIITGFFIFLLMLSQPLFAQSNGSELGLQVLLPVHIALMSLSGAGLITGALIAKYRKSKSKNWLKQHKAFQWSSAVIALLGIATAVIMVEIVTGVHLRVAHSIFAAASFALIVLAIIAAYGLLKRKTHKKELRIVHRWVGRFGILAWIVTIVLGLFTPLAGIF